ncbi:MAG TPA: type II toxin-antitoxin system VapC family toxin [Thermoanaerobaculia bacterium]|nr:type II toxin-antitoxin system VapC family toxin [Thermoanaerobaculia bacterium]
MGAAGGRLRFWDSSALLALAAREPSAEGVDILLQRDPDVALWWGAILECVEALAELRRHNLITEAGFATARALIERIRNRAFEVQPSEEVRARALRILTVHPLKAGRALQLAASLVWCREHTQGVGFVCLDEPLRLAAAQEGFRVLPYAGEVHEPEP